MNIITIAGRVGRDAELRHTPNGDAVASFSVADDQGKDKDAIWWRCSLWGKRAESLAQYITKGGHVTVTGTVSEREHDGKTYHDVRVVNIALQGSKQDGSSGAQNQRQAPQAQQQRRDAPQTGGGGFEGMDDDIPFTDPMKRRAFALSI